MADNHLRRIVEHTQSFEEGGGHIHHSLALPGLPVGGLPHFDPTDVVLILDRHESVIEASPKHHDCSSSAHGLFGKEGW
jgi:hypothetical protein